MNVSFSCFFGSAFRDFLVRNLHCKNRIKIVVFVFAMIAARPLIWSDRRCLMILSWAATWCFFGASRVLLGVPWVSPGCFLGGYLHTRICIIEVIQATPRLSDTPALATYTHTYS